jgi:hypothetical protein
MIDLDMRAKTIGLVRRSVKCLLAGVADETDFICVAQARELVCAKTAEGIDDHTQEDIEQDNQHDYKEGQVKDESDASGVLESIANTATVLKAIAQSELEAIPERIAKAISSGDFISIIQELQSDSIQKVRTSKSESNG